jgi:pimeloyl-ACP methyl ester carboxylesterase
MISFSKNARVALYLIRSYIYISTVPIALLCGGAIGSGSTQETPSGQSDVAEFRKLESALKLLRASNGRNYAITAPNGIDEAAYVEIGGIEQWITIRGQDRNNPVLLFLHGGPGDATNPWGYAAFPTWLKYFTVVQWDQRGAGKTFGRNGAASASTITPDRMVQDGIELVEWLKQKLHKEKIVLVGHSWGSVLGFFMVKARPDLFYAFVGTGQVAAELREPLPSHIQPLSKERLAKAIPRLSQN